MKNIALWLIILLFAIIKTFPMKKLYFSLIAFCFLCFANAQIVNIPDANFKAKLLAANSSNEIAKNLAGNYFKIDADSDGEIQESEALQVSYLNVSFSQISILNGIENFTNISAFKCNNNQLSSFNINSNLMLNSLECNNNQLTSLNVNSNLMLNSLECTNNQFNNLNLNNNIALSILYCEFNQLTSLDLSNNTSLTILYCAHNQLMTLNLSSNIALSGVNCSNNQLMSLFVKNGLYESYLNFDNNPNLLYICADESQFSGLQAQINF